MRILYTLNSSRHGGMEVHVLDLVESMVRLGHQVFVWCPEGEMSDLYLDAGAEVVNMEIKFDIDPSYILPLVKFLKRNKVDIVHSHELKTVSNSLIAGWVARTPVRISHTHTPISEWKISRIRKILNVIFYSTIVNLLSTKEIALTESRRDIKRLEGISAGKLEVIPNGVKIGKFDLTESEKEAYRNEIFGKYSIPPESFVFGYIGRLTVEKGVDVLIEAFSSYLEYAGVDENSYLIIAGRGRLEDELRKKAEELGVGSKVVFTGWFEDVEKVKLYSSLNVFVFPTLAEGFGIVLVEAMSSSLLIICSNLEVLNEVGGSAVRYFEMGNPQSLAEKMFNVYSKRDKLSVLGEQARKRVAELYSMEKFISSYENLYLNLLETS